MAACALAETTAEKTLIRVGSLKGPTTMGIVKLMQDDEQGGTAQAEEISSFPVHRYCKFNN